MDDVAYATLEWVAWFNTCRLLAPIGTFPQRSMRISLIGSSPLQSQLEHSTNRVSGEPGAVYHGETSAVVPKSSMRTQASEQVQDFAKYYNLEEYLFDEVSKRFGQRHTLSAFDFFCIVIWKANRAKSKVAKRMLSYGHTSLSAAVADLLQQVSGAEDAKGRLQVLTTSWGFRLPMASAILTVLYPEDFTVYDVRVCEVLGAFKEVQGKSRFEDLWDGYAAYVERVRIEAPLKSTLRDKDRYLWGKSFATQLERDVEGHFIRVGTDTQGG